jgi:hypothetical protein
MIINTGLSMSTARPDITTGMLKRELSQLYVMQMVSGETFRFLKEALVELTLGWHLLWIWVLVADITDEFIMGPDALHAHDISMDLKCHVLQQDDKEMS